jgi:hypothetical protein
MLNSGEMVVRIKSCKTGGWYKGEIGNVYTVEKKEGNIWLGYKVLNKSSIGEAGGRVTYYIKEEDFEVICS